MAPADPTRSARQARGGVLIPVDPTPKSARSRLDLHRELDARLQDPMVLGNRIQIALIRNELAERRWKHDRGAA